MMVTRPVRRIVGAVAHRDRYHGRRVPRRAARPSPSPGTAPCPLARFTPRRTRLSSSQKSSTPTRPSSRRPCGAATRRWTTCATTTARPRRLTRWRCLVRAGATCAVAHASPAGQARAVCARPLVTHPPPAPHTVRAPRLSPAEAIRHLNDPEHPLTLEQLNVTTIDGVTVDNERSTGARRRGTGARRSRRPCSRWRATEPG